MVTNLAQKVCAEIGVQLYASPSLHIEFTTLTPSCTHTSKQSDVRRTSAVRLKYRPQYRTSVARISDVRRSLLHPRRPLDVRLFTGTQHTLSTVLYTYSAHRKGLQSVHRMHTLSTHLPHTTRARSHTRTHPAGMPLYHHCTHSAHRC